MFSKSIINIEAAMQWIFPDTVEAEVDQPEDVQAPTDEPIIDMPAKVEPHLSKGHISRGLESDSI